MKETETKAPRKYLSSFFASRSKFTWLHFKLSDWTFLQLFTTVVATTKTKINNLSSIELIWSIKKQLWRNWFANYMPFKCHLANNGM